MHGSAAHVVTDAGADLGFVDEKFDYGSEAPSAGGVEHGFAETVGGLHEVAFLGEGAEGVNVVAAHGVDLVSGVRLKVFVGVG